MKFLYILYALNLCLNSNDEKIWNNTGKNNLKNDMVKCGQECIGKKDCTIHCVMNLEGYSKECSGCFGDLGECSVKHCFYTCIGGDTPGCESCVKTNCYGEFSTCTGWSLTF